MRSELRLHRLLLGSLLLGACSREPVPVAPDGMPPSLEDDNYFGRYQEAAPPDAGPPDHRRASPDLRAPEPSPPIGKPPTCKPGERMWCSSLQYSGWGLVACDPATGRWREKLTGTGKTELDCLEQPTGERPNTVCACYHFYYNPACCERPDCVLLPGESGAICPASKGALCDYCNPLSSECKEPGAKCVITNAHETFCAPSEPCPAGYQCMVVKLQGGATTNQCVPSDLSCYH